MKLTQQWTTKEDMAFSGWGYPSPRKTKTFGTLYDAGLMIQINPDPRRPEVWIRIYEKMDSLTSSARIIKFRALGGDILQGRLQVDVQAKVAIFSLSFTHIGSKHHAIAIRTQGHEQPAKMDPKTDWGSYVGDRLSRDNLDITIKFTAPSNDTTRASLKEAIETIIQRAKCESVNHMSDLVDFPEIQTEKEWDICKEVSLFLEANPNVLKKFSPAGLEKPVVYFADAFDYEATHSIAIHGEIDVEEQRLQQTRSLVGNKWRLTKKESSGYEIQRTEFGDEFKPLRCGDVLVAVDPGENRGRMTLKIITRKENQRNDTERVQIESMQGVFVDLLKEGSTILHVQVPNGHAIKKDELQAIRIFARESTNQQQGHLPWQMMKSGITAVGVQKELTANHPRIPAWLKTVRMLQAERQTPTIKEKEQANTVPVAIVPPVPDAAGRIKLVKKMSLADYKTRVADRISSKPNLDLTEAMPVDIEIMVENDPIQRMSDTGSNASFARCSTADTSCFVPNDPSSPPTSSSSANPFDMANVSNSTAVRGSEFTRNLNKEQRLAFNCATSPSNGITLVTGPPGTGKTELIKALVVSLAKKGLNVLVCGAANSQLDDLALKLDKMKQLLDPNGDYHVSRVYSTRKERTEAEQYTCYFDDSGDAHHERTPMEPGFKLSDVKSEGAMKLTPTVRAWNELCQSNDMAIHRIMTRLKNEQDIYESEEAALEQAWLETETQVIARSRIIVSTCVNSKSARLRSMYFDYLVIDEAAQILEATSLVPITSFRMLSGLLMVGDLKQNGPVIRSGQNQNSFKPQLEMTLFERLVHIGFQHIKLVTQYRMSEEVLEFPNQQFYECGLKTGFTHNAYAKTWREFCTHRNWPSGVMLLRSSKVEASKNAQHSWYNESHAKFVIKLLFEIRSTTNIPFSEIVIMTPYKAQRSLYHTKLASLSKTNPDFTMIRVNTFDSFQGQEGGVVFVDIVVDGNLSKEIKNNNQTVVPVGFLRDDRRICVACTRAQYGMVVIGESIVLKHLTKEAVSFRAWIDYFQAKKQVRPMSIMEKRDEDRLKRRPADEQVARDNCKKPKQSS